MSVTESNSQDILPYITSDFPGIGGELKSTPADFVVEELPLYEPSGEGEHVYFTTRRSGWNTRDLIQAIAKGLGISGSTIGSAGLKDKHATATQTFSIYDPKLDPEKIPPVIDSLENVELLGMARHGNKLRTGHLRGNRFGIRVEGVSEGALDLLPDLVDSLKEQGFPNYPGEQRFGQARDNARRGLEILLGQRKERGWLRGMLLSSIQSRLFNRWLQLRIEAGLYGTLLEGDLARKTESGGLFRVEDLAAEEAAFKIGDLSYTGPMYGKKMRDPVNPVALELEERVLRESGLERDHFSRAGLDGSRRSGRMVPRDLEFEIESPRCVRFTFTLPAGSYATSLMREIMKVEPGVEQGPPN